MLKCVIWQFPLPSIAAQTKFNAAICVMEQLPSRIRTAATKYVAVECSGFPLLRPTPVLCLYLHPNNNDINDATLSAAIRDLQEWTSEEEKEYVIMVTSTSITKNSSPNTNNSPPSSQTHPGHATNALPPPDPPNAHTKNSTGYIPASQA